MGKKKFIDRKKSATFQLLARDTAGFSSSDSDRVFVRVDNNPYSCPPIFEDGEGDEEDVLQSITPKQGQNRGQNSIFDDAPDDEDDGGEDDKDEDVVGPPQPFPNIPTKKSSGGSGLPDHVRREILELGFPDDGYNYLLHLREIKNAGGGAQYYHNSRAELDKTPLDIKAYDASRVRVNPELRDDGGEGGEDVGDLIYNVAAKTRRVKVQRAVDPDVAQLLDDSDLSRFGSDVEELEEDFVVKANVADEEGDEIDEEDKEEMNAGDKCNVAGDMSSSWKGFSLPLQSEYVESEDGQLRGSEKPRVRRLIDEQFDLLTRREYDSESDDDYRCSEDSEHDMLKTKLENSLKQFSLDDPKFQDEFGVFGHDESAMASELDASAEVIRRCVEYAERYLNESDEEKVVYVESSDESDGFDCESILSTYSTLDNHPGKIKAPENPKKRLEKVFPGELVAKHNVIALGGKEKIPVEFLPHRSKNVSKVKPESDSIICKPKRKPHCAESKEEKKERKAAVKEERREARKAKKGLKCLYKCESQRAQKVAAVAGLSTRPLS